MRRAPIFLLLAAMLGGCGETGVRERAQPASQVRAVASQPHGLRVVDAVAPDFALPDESGEIVRLSAQRGKAVLLTFLYSNCQDVCPLIATKLAEAARSLPSVDRRQLVILAVSVDPAHDTRSAVQRFIRRLGLPAQFHYLVGTTDELQPVWQGYNLTVDVKNVEVVNHSAYVLLLDRGGKPRLYYRPSFAVRFLVHDLLRVLAHA